MVFVCDYDSQRDIHAVEPFGFINLCEAYVNGVVPGDISMDSISFNGVDDPASLLGRPDDVFDAYRRAEYVSKFGASAQSEVTTSNGVSE